MHMGLPVPTWSTWRDIAHWKWNIRPGFPQPMKNRVSSDCPFKVIEGKRSWCQLNSHIWLPMNDYWQLCTYLLWFLRYRPLKIWVTLNCPLTVIEDSRSWCQMKGPWLFINDFWPLCPHLVHIFYYSPYKIE